MKRRGRARVRRLPTSFFDALGEAGLVLFSMAVVLGFLRLFLDGSFFVPVVASTVSAHVLAAAVRWARGGLIISVLVSALGLVVSSALLYPPTTVDEPGRFINEAVLRGFGTDLELAWEQFQQVAAPAEVTAPFLLLIAIVMWVVAFLADWAAFRLDSPVEALIPGSAVFVFGALFAADQNRLSTSVIFIGAALVFLLFHRLGEASIAGAWLGAGAVQRGQTALLRSGLALLVVTLGAGAIAAQSLPGYDDEPIYDLSELDEPETPRVVISPLVDIRASLVSQPDVEVFTVAAGARDYWRITSLDVFDGRIWKSRGSFESARGPLDTDLPSGTRFESVTQRFDIRNLGGIFLPAAYEPAEVLSAPEGVVFEYERESGTLIVSRELANADGLEYTLISAVPGRDPETIASAGDDIPPEIRERFLELPPDFGERVTTLAEDIVAGAGATTPYTKALALQNFFRDPSLFRYDLEVASGHSVDRLEDFLFEIRAGYCEQFAGSFAAMARAIGLPSRVAVGFTPGELDTETGAYRVSGRHAHAWPEIWVDGVGWLRFEPTPGRGGPGDEPYTGVPEQQASDLPGNAPTTLPPASSENTVPLDPEAGGVPDLTTTTVSPQSDRANSGVIGGEGGLSTVVVVGWLLFLGALLALLVVPVVFGVVRATRRARRAAGDPTERIGLAWGESKRAVELLGIPVHGSDTPLEVAERVAVKNPRVAGSVAELADDVSAASYSGTTVVEDRAQRAEAITRTLAGEARAHTGAVAWWKHHMNPKNVWLRKNGLWRHLRARSRLD